MSNEKYIFRRARKEDSSAVYALYKSVLGDKFCVWNEAYPDMLEINGDLDSENLFVLTDDEKIIGAISIVPENELDGFSCWTCRDGAELARVVIAKEHRGNGLSVKLVNEAEKILCQRGCMSIHLSVAKSNLPAYKTYIKTSFKVVGDAQMYGGDYYLMEKSICDNVKAAAAVKQVIHIYGASGSGTSTLGKYICEKTGFFFMDTDDYFWLPTDPPYTTKRCASERLRLMREDIEQHEHAVISGSLTDWGDELIPLFTLAIRIETNTDTRLERIKAREHEKFGSRIDVGGDMHGEHLNFINWAAAYDDGGFDMRSWAKHDAWQKLLCCPLITVDGSMPTERNFELIKSLIPH